ncbi:MAG: hypothetical protein EHM28_09790 [Spirochaetaceae bacterium]|nr:MAG: hypothetical protein EHM28_09790 [Spirochaetaceae bacterium]
MKKAVLFAFCALVILIQTGFSQYNPAQEELVYFLCNQGPARFNTPFYSKAHGTIYVMAGKTHAINSKSTVMQYNEQQGIFQPSDDFLFLPPVEGMLEITDGNGTVTKLTLAEFALGIITETDASELLTSENAEGGRIDRIYSGAEAVTALKDFELKVKKFEEEVTVFNKQMEAYQKVMDGMQKKMDDLISEYTRRQEKGEDTSVVLAQAQALESMAPPPPSQPAMPQQVIDLKKAFFIKLAAGTYKIRMLTNDGQVIEGSDKKIIAYPETNKLGIGYDIIPYGTYWIAPNDSRFAGSVIYLSGAADIILRPYVTEEYPEPEYSLSVHVLMKPIPGMPTQVKLGYPRSASLFEITQAGNRQLLPLSPFVPGVSSVGVGFSIVELEKAEIEGTQVHESIEVLQALMVKTKGASGVIPFSLLTDSKEIIPGSEREIRIVGKADLFVQIAVATGLAILPFIIWFLLWFFAAKPKEQV